MLASCRRSPIVTRELVTHSSEQQTTAREEIRNHYTFVFIAFLSSPVDTPEMYCYKLTNSNLGFFIPPELTVSAITTVWAWPLVEDLVKELFIPWVADKLKGLISMAPNAEIALFLLVALGRSSD